MTRPGIELRSPRHLANTLLIRPMAWLIIIIMIIIWINNMTRELEGLEEGPKAEIDIELLKKTLKKISN